VLGICNGFQILLEAGLLPGAMLRNRGLKYRCEYVHLRVEQTDTPFTCAAAPGQVLQIPIGHGEGNYFAPPEVLERLEANRQVVLRYTDPAGRVADESSRATSSDDSSTSPESSRAWSRDDSWNPNGSINAIASVCNESRNVVGMMPHPERACEPLLGGIDGRLIFASVSTAFSRVHARGSAQKALDVA